MYMNDIVNFLQIIIFWEIILRKSLQSLLNKNCSFSLIIKRQVLNNYGEYFIDIQGGPKKNYDVI